MSTSTYDRLKKLPDIFRGGDLTLLFNWSPKQASHYLYLWRSKGFVESLGGHSDIHANLLMERKPDWEKALVMAMPSAVLTGIEVLRRAGWCTQIQARPSVAVNSTFRTYVTERFSLDRRDSRWFKRVKDGIRDTGGALPALAPAWALAEMLRVNKGWEGTGLAPDDIYWDEVSDADRADWGAACKALSLGDVDGAEDLECVEGEHTLTG